MKTIKQPLFETFASVSNLIKAIENSARHKLKRARIRKILANKEKVAQRLHNVLMADKLKFPKHVAQVINDGIERKTRIIVKPTYYELIIQWAIVQVLNPYLMKGMYHWSCGSIKKRGAIYGKNYLERYIRENPKKIKYVCKCDIHHFFESVDIQRLKDIFKNMMRDKQMQNVINKVLDCNFVELKGQMIDVGLPIGFYTSQHFANFYLQSFDHYVKEKLSAECYIRYVDDFIFFGSNKKELHAKMKLVSEYLNSIGLKLKSNYQVFRFDYTRPLRKGRPVDFMGYKFYRDKTTIRTKTFLKSMRKFKKVSRLNVIDLHSARQVLCYVGYYKHSDSYKVFAEKVTPLINVGKCKKIVSYYDKRKENENVIKLEECRKFNQAVAC